MLQRLFWRYLDFLNTLNLENQLQTSIGQQYKSHVLPTDFEGNHTRAACMLFAFGSLKIYNDTNCLSSSPVLKMHE